MLANGSFGGLVWLNSEGLDQPNQLWVAAYCNDVFGYLPSSRVLGEGGYETRGLYSGVPGFFDPKAEEVVVRAVRELARKAGRRVKDE